MHESGTIAQALADALVAEAGRFFGHIAYASLSAIHPTRDTNRGSGAAG